MTFSSPETQAEYDPLLYLEGHQDALAAAVSRKDLADKLDAFSSKWDTNKFVLANLEALAAHGGSFRGVQSSALEEASDALSKIASFAGDMETASTREAIESLIEDIEEWLKGPNGRLARSIKQAYEDLVRAEFDPLQAAGGVLVRIDAMSGLGSRLNALVTRARGLASRPLPELLASIAAVRAEATALKGEYEAIDNVQGAKAFLDALIDGKATLTHVTPAVLEWLDTLDGAREGFKITSA